MSAAKLAEIVKATVAQATPKGASAPKAAPKTRAQYEAERNATQTTPKGASAPKATPKRATHTLTRFGHWADSARGRLDTALDCTQAEAKTVAELAATAQVTEARVRVHLGDLRAQQAGAWTHHNSGLAVNCLNGRYWVTYDPPAASAEVKAQPALVTK